jgi:hypothetical protein
MHHRMKKDAPSGTATTLLEILADTRKLQLKSALRHGRHGITGERTRTEIGAHALRGGDVVVRGDVGARSGIDQKGGTIIVGGNAGTMTGFMLQRGRQVICGNVGGGLGDSMYDGAIYVGGKVTSLGVDCIEAELDASDDEFLARKLGIYGIEAPASWRKFVCGRKLWNYDNLEPAERKLVL